MSSHDYDLDTRNKVLTAKLLKHRYRYNLREAFYRRHLDIVFECNLGLKTLLLHDLSEPEFYRDLVYKLKKMIKMFFTISKK